MGNRGFVGLHSVEGYLLVTICGFMVLAAIVAGALWMRRVMANETRLRREMRADIESRKLKS